MSKLTTIGWCDSTVNSTSGCDGCEILKTCYARKLHEERLAKVLPRYYDPSFLNVRLIPGRMASAAHWSDLSNQTRGWYVKGGGIDGKPWLNGKPRHIFISDLSDMLSKAVPFGFLRDEVIKNVTSEKGQRHIWLWLTKQPERMVAFARLLTGYYGKPWPDNLYVGTSVTNQHYADLRIPWLLKVPAKVRFVSYEPALGPVSFFEWFRPIIHRPVTGQPDVPDIGKALINWVIVGGESGQDFRRMDLNWLFSAMDQCRSAGIPCFIKQDSGPRPGRQGRIPDCDWVRKEMP